MNTSPSRNMQQHVTLLGWLYLVGHAVFLLIGLFVFVLLTGIGVATGEPEARSILSIVGTAVGVLLAALAVPGLAAGYGLLRRFWWARTLAIVVGILNLINVPLGTALGVYTLWVLTQLEAIDSFDAATPPRPVAR